MNKLLAFVLAFIPFAASAQTAQTWVKIAVEGQTVSVPAGATLRFGAAAGTPAASAGAKPCTESAGCWTQATPTAALAGVVSPALIADPIVGTVKELDILQGATAQTVTVDGASVTIAATPVAVPVVVPPAAPAKTLIKQWVCTVPVTFNLYSDGSTTASGDYTCPETL